MRGRPRRRLLVRAGNQYQEQAERQRQRGARYENHTSLTGHVTHGLKPGYARGLQPKEKKSHGAS